MPRQTCTSGDATPPALSPPCQAARRNPSRPCHCHRGHATPAHHPERQAGQHLARPSWVPISPSATAKNAACSGGTQCGPTRSSSSAMTMLPRSAHGNHRRLARSVAAGAQDGGKPVGQQIEHEQAAEEGQPQHQCAQRRLALLEQGGDRRARLLGLISYQASRARQGPH